ncbi:Uracil DNA glycosylase superfamily protein [Roseimaritima multifibrata]|uniref:Uracil DNA glycosylase superfamily protein n=1 Tax=Roseimaritima multifibrata TaxID=1930274 RepID=A0A517MGC7_9BACT|nr:uracil-DNA glycosylase family protein [Roseimaritima multifibrata]QDS93938.1 Uracil DNA glycosylase superfamily protein [Roseimaritima multifibrata]
MKLPVLLKNIRQCRECGPHLALGTRPVVQAASEAKILIIGQAPGRRVHLSGIPWDDASGGRLRDWMGIQRDSFYDPAAVAIMPMGFCYPGSGKSGDLPPRRECARLWHQALLEQLTAIKLTLLIGAYAQAYYLPKESGSTLTENVKNWRSFAPTVFPLPHPSPRNNGWLKQNPWFANDVLPMLQQTTAELLNE